MVDEKKDDGGPAFPRPAYEIESETRDTVIWGSGQSGMTLRDYFAAKALAAIMTNPCPDSEPPEVDGLDDINEIRAARVKVAYSYADLMLEARKKGS